MMYIFYIVKIYINYIVALKLYRPCNNAISHDTTILQKMIKTSVFEFDRDTVSPLTNLARLNLNTN